MLVRQAGTRSTLLVAALRRIKMAVSQALSAAYKSRASLSHILSDSMRLTAAKDEKRALDVSRATLERFLHYTNAKGKGLRLSESTTGP